MSVLIAASAIRTCLGDSQATFSALIDGISGVSKLRYFDHSKLRVTHAYQITESDEEDLFRASRWLTHCTRVALAESGIDPEQQRVVAIIGTGLREMRTVERSEAEPLDFSVEQLHFASAVQQGAPHIADVFTLSNACSASGHALALGQDLIELGDADAVLVGGADSITESMLAMIGRFVDQSTDHVRPFDAGRAGVLLGEGAAAVVLVPEGATRRPLARLLSTGLSCDASHETVPHAEGISRAMKDALARAGRLPEDVDLVLAHGTGTALNDPLEANLIRSVFASNGPGPLITAVKGATGHTSGGAALVNLDVAIHCLQQSMVPPIVGLNNPLADGVGLRFVIGSPVEASLRLATINAFGFGGVNSVTLIEGVQ